MKSQWTQEELVEHFVLLPNERKLVDNKKTNTKLGFAVMFKYFQQEARFPTEPSLIPLSIINYLAKQIKIPANQWEHYSWKGRSIKRHRAEIREYFGFREHSKQDVKVISRWLIENVLDHTQDEESLKDRKSVV